MKETPHKVTVKELWKYEEDRWDNFASATTADGTQRKHLDVRIGSHGYRVQRRYFAEKPDTWATIYEGRDLEEAVRIYNGLS